MKHLSKDKLNYFDGLENLNFDVSAWLTSMQTPCYCRMFNGEQDHKSFTTLFSDEIFFDRQDSRAKPHKCLTVMSLHNCYWSIANARTISRPAVLLTEPVLPPWQGCQR